MELDIKDIFLVIVWGIIGVCMGIIIGKILRHKTLQNERAMSIKKSKSVILGEVYEKILPFLPDFPYAPKDMIFVGKGVDYIVFDGLNEENLQNIVFLEVKSGKSQLNKNEKMIRDAVNAGKVQYKEYRV